MLTGHSQRRGDRKVVWTSTVCQDKDIKALNPTMCLSDSQLN